MAKAKEMSVAIEDNVLVIRLPMQEPTESQTGKTLVVATTHGNIPTEVKVKGKVVKIGVNAFIPNK